MITYTIKKKMVDSNGKTLHVLMTDGSSAILEFDEDEKVKATDMVDVLNANTDSGWEYRLVTIGT